MVTGKMVTYNREIAKRGMGEKSLCGEEVRYLDNYITPAHLQPEDY